MRTFLFGLIVGAILGSITWFVSNAPRVEGDVQVFVDFLLEDPERFESVPLREVVQAVSGKEVLPVDLGVLVDAEMLQVVSDALDRTLSRLAVSDHPIHKVGRVNEISRHVEDALLEELNGVSGYRCAVPLNASGEVQRSGYPDLRLLHEASGRVFYIDPKVYKQGSETSSFRTFYFEPQRDTNKILDTASHLIVGVAHGGKVDGQWKLERWRLIDLYEFKVRLKAEFQASNRDLYQKDAELQSSAQ